ncbi:MAG: DNA replication protein DnaC, partial [Persephonella sp.]
MARKDCPKCKGLGWISLGNSVVKCECVYSELNNMLYIRM